MKPCIRCHQIKPLDAFHRNPGMKDGRLNKCAVCVKECVDEWRAKNPGVRKREYERSIERGAIPAPKYRKGKGKDPVKRRASSLRFTHKRIARVTTPMLELDAFAFDEAMDLAVKREAATGIKWHIDHRVPLHHKLASGLHVAANFQVVPATWNMRKGNKTMADYWPVAH